MKCISTVNHLNMKRCKYHAVHTERNYDRADKEGGEKLVIECQKWFRKRSEMKCFCMLARLQPTAQSSTKITLQPSFISIITDSRAATIPTYTTSPHISSNVFILCHWNHVRRINIWTTTIRSLRGVRVTEFSGVIGYSTSGAVRSTHISILFVRCNCLSPE